MPKSAWLSNDVLMVARTEQKSKFIQYSHFSARPLTLAGACVLRHLENGFMFLDGLFGC
jgi:hypothetical protein